MKNRPLSPAEVSNYEAQLRRLLASFADEVHSIEVDSLEPSGGARFQVDDEVVEEVALEQDLDALAVADQQGYEVRDALERIRAGSYGRCTACDAPISRERLDAVPYARECAPCARASGSRRSDGETRHG